MNGGLLKRTSGGGGAYQPVMTATTGGLVPTPPNDANYSLDGTGVFSKKFAQQSDWANAISDYSASGVNTKTTTAASTTAGSTTVYLTDASSFKASQGIAIVGAGTAGADHITTISSVNTASNYVVLNVATIATVASGATVYHDDTVALSSFYNDNISLNGYLPIGKYNTSSLITVSQSYRNFYGVESSYNYANTGSIIYVRGASGAGLNCDTLTLQGSFIRLHGLTLLKHPDLSWASYTSGAGVTVGPSSGTNTTGVNLEKVNIIGMYEGVLNQLVNTFKMSDLVIGSFLKNGVRVNSPIPVGGNTHHNLFITGYATSSTGPVASVNAGISITASDLAQWTNLHFFQCKYGINNSGGQVQTFSNTSFDGNYNGGYPIYDTSTANVYNGGTMNLGNALGAGYIHGTYTRVTNFVTTDHSGNAGFSNGGGVGIDISGNI